MSSFKPFPFALPLTYVDRERISIVFEVELGDGSGTIYVIGDPGNGAYEWCRIDPEGHALFSDKGYGMAALALRDGLAVTLLSSPLNISVLAGQARFKTATQLKCYRRV